jgi:hypothetical protein
MATTWVLEWAILQFRRGNHEAILYDGNEYTALYW